MDLSQRISAMVSMIDEDYVADIGTDHGYLPLALLAENRAKKVLAADISDKSLDKLRKNLSPTENRIILKVFDGLTGLVSPFPDLVVISGMGGALIINILKKDLGKTRKIGKFILQPNTQAKELRKFLHENGFKITDEKFIFEEGRYYPIIQAELGKEDAYRDFELEYGKVLLERKDPVTYRKIKADQARLDKIYQKLKNGSVDSDRQDKLEIELKEIKEALKYYEA